MSFREKSAWVTLIALLIVTGMYVLHVPHLVEPRPSGFIIMVIGLSVGAFILIELVAHVVLAIRNPKDARTPRDERERLIDVRAARVAYYVYVAASFIAVAVMVHLVRGTVTGLGTAVLLAFVLGEIVKYATRIVLYRRDR